MDEGKPLPAARAAAPVHRHPAPDLHAGARSSAQLLGMEKNKDEGERQESVCASVCVWCA